MSEEEKKDEDLTPGSAFRRLMDSIKISPEQQAKFDAQFDAHEKWHKEHPDHGERYGTDRSYWLETIREKGHSPIGITVMLCEETLIFATEEETDAAAEAFMPEGWWYNVSSWEESRTKYVNDMYEGVESDAPEVFCLDDKYKDIIK